MHTPSSTDMRAGTESADGVERSGQRPSIDPEVDPEGVFRKGRDADQGGRKLEDPAQSERAETRPTEPDEHCQPKQDARGGGAWYHYAKVRCRATQPRDVVAPADQNCGAVRDYEQRGDRGKGANPCGHMIGVTARPSTFDSASRPLGVKRLASASRKFR
jgi:hypothetical protein